MDTKGKRLRLLYPDVLGWSAASTSSATSPRRGHAAFCVGVYPLTHDREILTVPNTQFDVGLHDIEVDAGPRVAAPGLGDRHRRGHRRRQRARGAACPSTRATCCAGRCEAWRAMGLTPQISFELEFYLMEPRTRAAAWRPVALPGHRVYGTGMAVDPSGCVDAMVGALLACGFTVESWCTEYDDVRLRGQHPVQRRASRRPTRRSCSGC